MPYKGYIDKIEKNLTKINNGFYNFPDSRAYVLLYHNQFPNARMLATGTNGEP